MKKVYTTILSVTLLSTLGFAQNRIAGTFSPFSVETNKTITVQGDPCGLLTNFDTATSTPAIYTLTPANCGGNGWGYVSGHNCWDDRAKADFFAASNGDTIHSAYIFFFLAHDGSGNSTADVKVWNGTTGSPGAVLASVTVPLSTVAPFPSPTLVTFNPPVVVPGNFFLGVQFKPNGIPQDTVVILTNSDGDTNPGTAWELWNTGSWYAYSHSSTWGINVAHAIFVWHCPGPSSIGQLTDAHMFNIYPNPSSGIFYLKFINKKTMGYENTEIKVTNLLGEIVYTRSVKGMLTTIDLSHQPAGLYFYTITSGTDQSTGRLNIVR